MLMMSLAVCHSPGFCGRIFLKDISFKSKIWYLVKHFDPWILTVKKIESKNIALCFWEARNRILRACIALKQELGET